MADYHLLRVFSNPDGDYGNELGVFLNGSEVRADERQAVAAELGYSETVFVDDAVRGEIRIFTPEIELPFAGHPSVGTAWLLAESGHEVDVLRVPAGELPVRREAELTWIAAKPEWSPPFRYVELDSPAAVDALEGPSAGEEWAYCWAWEDRGAGSVRARAFVTGGGIEEDEATGSAALALCGQLGREISVRQGRGSRIEARPIDDGFVEIGGRVEGGVIRGST